MSETTTATDSTKADSTNAGGSTVDVGRVVADLRAAFRSGRTRDLQWRRSQLQGLLRMLDEHEDDFVQALHEDLGRPSLEGYFADVGMTKAEIKYLLRHVGSWMKPRKVIAALTSAPARAKVIAEPLGVGLIMAPWNYPIYLLLCPLAAALAAGNGAVVKPSELSPACSATLARLMPRYVDDQAVVVVEGGVETATALLEEQFDHIFFTGSTSVGRAVMTAAAKHLTPVVLELGGKSPAIVAADADLGVAAHRIVWGKHINAGQTCVAPDYVLVEASIRDRLVDKMVETMGEFLGADPQASKDFGRIVNDRHFDRLDQMLGSHGGTIAAGGSTDAATRFVEPTIIVDPDLDAPIMREEIFGPLLPVVSVESIADAIDFVNDRPKPLALYIFTGSGDSADRVLAETSSGGACVNHTVMHLGSPTLPFGGVGPSGMGSYHGRAGFDAFSHHKSVLTKPQKPDPPLMYPPYTSLKSKIVHKAL
jgi:aldehyde dehydrogenase (NAD+)